MSITVAGSGHSDTAETFISFIYFLYKYLYLYGSRGMRAPFGGTPLPGLDVKTVFKQQ